MKKIMSLLLVLTLILSTTMTANASTEAPTNSLQKYVKIDDSGHLYLSKEISSTNLGNTQIDIMDEVIASYNNMLDSGYYTLISTTEVVPTEKYYQHFGMQARGGGRNLALTIGPNLYKVWIDNNVCKKITTGLNVGSVFATLIPNPVAAIGVAASVVFYSSVIGNTNRGNGVTFIVSTLAFVPYNFQPQ